MAAHTRSSKAARKLFAAQLLFQFRVRIRNRSNQRRVCEIRTVLIPASNGERALQIALRCGRAEQFDYADGPSHVYFEFVGVKELLDLPATTSPAEVWWDLVTIERPKERRAQLIPKARELRAFSVVTKRRSGPKV